MSGESPRQTAWQAKSVARPRGQFCPDCGGALFFDYRGGQRPPTCSTCGYVRYRNPAVGVAVVVRDDTGRVLMGRRASGAYAGLWCIPCGYVEWDEDVRAAAIREMREETGVEVELGEVIAVHSNFHNTAQHTVGIWFAGRIVSGEPHLADGEFTEIACFEPANPPPLAFPTDALVLRELAGIAPSR